jgi:hypothetical protein
MVLRFHGDLVPKPNDEVTQFMVTREVGTSRKRATHAYFMPLFQGLVDDDTDRADSQQWDASNLNFTALLSSRHAVRGMAECGEVVVVETEIVLFYLKR